jgi:hypothetical protein
MTPGPDPEPSTGAFEPLLRHFRYAHLADERLRAFSQRYAALAEHVVDSMAPSAERTLALRHLIAAKDQGVRALLDHLYPATEPPPNRPVDVQARCVAHVPAHPGTGSAALRVCGAVESDPVHDDARTPNAHEFIAPPTIT